MKKEHVNPASWQEKFGYSQGCRVDEAQRLLFVAGQIALDENGDVVGDGDFEAQARQVFTNMGRVLELAGMSFENLVQIGGFLIDIGQLRSDRRTNKGVADVAARAGIARLPFGPWSGVCTARRYLLDSAVGFSAFDAGSETWSAIVRA